MDNAPPASERELSAFDIGCVVVGGIIGVGIFFTPAKVAERAGSTGLALLTWAAGGALAMLGALVFAELSTRVPGHGGIFRYIHAAFGRLPAFLYGWSNWLVIQAGALSVVALLCVQHLELALWGTRAAAPGVQVLAAAAAILVFTATNLVGLRVGKRVQNVLTVTKVLALCLLVLAAAAHGVAGGGDVAGEGPGTGAAPPAPEGSALHRLGGAMLPVLFAIGGWQQGSFVAGAARDPLRTVPRGIIVGVAVVIGVYLLVNLAYLRVLGLAGAAAADPIGAAAARAMLDQHGERVFAALVAVSAAGIMNTICMAPPYVLLAMAEQGLFPRAFARRHATSGAPVVGTLGQGLWAVLLMVGAHLWASVAAGEAAPRTIDTLGFLCDGVVFVDWLFFTLCGGALLVLRRRGGPAPFALRAGGAVATAFTLGAAAVTVGAVATNRLPSVAGGALAALGLLGWFVLRPRRARGSGVEPAAPDRYNAPRP